MQRVVGDPVRGQNAVLTFHCADVANCAAIVVPDCFDGLYKCFSDSGVHARVACKQHAVAAIQRNRALLPKQDGCEKLFEIREIHGAMN